MDRLSTKGQMIDQVDLSRVPHSGFDRSNHNYGTGKLGAIIPVRLDEVYPGDRIKGKPELVVNFEPLVAPLMGSMVLKQESFFVPYIQLWKNGYKFFTGKNGFDQSMPTISPLDVFHVYYDYLHTHIWGRIGKQDTTALPLEGFAVLVKSLSDLYAELSTNTNGKFSDLDPDGFSLLQRFIDVVEQVQNIHESVYADRKMLDLVTPACQIFERYSKSDELIEFSKTFEDTNISVSVRRGACLRFAAPLGDIIQQYFDFFHGPSSLCDYLGWPVPISKDNAFAIPEYGITTIFQYVIYRNIFIYGSVDMSQEVKKLFSSVPLVFNPFKAYYLIWYWNYRDQLLETGILDPDEDEFLGGSITENIVLYCTIMRQRCWFKDTYTTALTNTGDGNLLVPTNFDNVATSITYYDDNGTLVNTDDGSTAWDSGATIAEIEQDGITYRVPMNYLRGAISANGNTPAANTAGSLSLDLFDRIKRLRSFVQKRLILGYEVDDVIYSSFMVTLSNVRMHVPEILGRGRDAVHIQTLVNSTTTTEQIAGDKTATAWVHGQQSDMNYFSEEWGLFLTFATIMPIQSYAGGMQRLYLKTDPLDYMWPEFATMGMDAVYNTELAAVGARLTDEQGMLVFGYQGRYYDLKSRQDEEHGRLLTDLNYLTFSREWSKNNPPKLNYIFVHCWPRLDGFVIESPTMDVFRYDCYNAHAWERRLPVPSEYV